ncbi:MAG: hypothetical protein N3F67_01780 [Acidilobaceae archaeon]|nr:hypothetical protein [Acidilobaceae archaeon]
MEVNRLGDCRAVILLFDANMLILLSSGAFPFSRLDEAVESSYVAVVPSSVVEELRRLAERGSRASKRALEFASAFKVVETAGNADDALVELALGLKGRCRVIVATSDADLRRRLRSLGIPTLYYRESRRDVELDWRPL